MDANNPRLVSWIEVKNGSDFPIQNIPFGVIQHKNGRTAAATAIGSFVLDLSVLQDNGYFDDLGLTPNIFNQPNLNLFLSSGRSGITSVRNRLSTLLRHDNEQLKSNSSIVALALHNIYDVKLLMPIDVPNYTDFYSSEEHARNVGSMFRDPKNALLPNWKHLPVGYHGRASSIVVSGTEIYRPKGQIKLPDQDSPVFSQTRKLDFELEVAFITCKENALGTPIPVEKAAEHIGGFLLFNDWSARDIQQWEYVPLGPFLAKNFASTISPWIVTLDALEPFRVNGPAQDPPVLPYLKSTGSNNFDINLQVSIIPPGGEESIVTKTNFRYMYWNVLQQLAHHTVNGCNIKVGDMYASGTISGPDANSFGSLLELSFNGKNPIRLTDGSERTFLNDGDEVVMSGFAEKNGVRIGFGDCRGRILAAK